MITNIHKHWKIKKLGEIANISSGTTPFRKNPLFYDNADIPWVKTTDLNNSYITTTEEKVSMYALNNTSLRLYPTNTVLVAMYGGFNQIGRTGKLAMEATINQALSALVLKNDDVNSDYLLFWLNANVEKWKRFAGSSRKDPNINGKDVAEFSILIPPLKEQEKIAEILLTCDKAIRLTTQIITQLKQRNQGLAQQLLTGEKRVKGFKNSIWKEVRLGEIGEISSAGVDKKVIEGEKPIRLLNYLDVYKRNFIHSDELTHWVTTTDEKIQKCNILQGDVFFTPSSEVRNDIAISAVAIEDIEEAVYSYHIVRLRFKKKIDLNFKAFMFKTDFFFKQAQFLSEGSGTRYVISQSNFKNIKIFLPTYEEQKTIGNILLKAEKELKLYEQKLQLLQAQKKTLMQKLLTGEILTIK